MKPESLILSSSQKTVLGENVARKSVLLLCSLAVLFLGVAAPVRGQSPLDGFDPNANGIIRVVVVQPDGKILIGGDFTTLSPNGGASVPRNRIARLNPDGTLDTAFNPNASNNVHSIAVQPDGKILAGGSFTNIGGQTRNRIARLDATTGLADSFNPNASGNVLSIAVQPDGKILAGGSFTNLGGQTRNRIARLDAETGLADSFDPNANGDVNVMVVQSDGKILVGGAFNGANSIGGQTRNRIARLDATTGLADSFNPNASGNVLTIAVQPDGKILAGGDFSFANSIGGQARNRIARLDPFTGLADSFNPSASSRVNSIVVQADGRILVSGFFSTIGLQNRNFIARLDPITGLADSFDPNVSADSSVNTIALQADGKIVVGGGFTAFAPNGGSSVTRNRIARFETDGTLDRQMGDLNISSTFVVSVYATAVQPDGKILIGGLFENILGTARTNLARLNRDGTLDTGFNPIVNRIGVVYAIAVQADGKILVGGTFTNISGQTRNRIARLDALTGLADSYNPNVNTNVYAIAVQEDGKILAGGAFTNVSGQTRNRIARLDGITGLPDSFNPNANNLVYSIAVQADGKILVGGGFSSIGGQTRTNIARLDAATGLADSFNPNTNANGVVYAIAVQTNDKIFAGGNFTTFGGQTRGRIARIDSATGSVDSFNPNANDDVFSIMLQADGKVLTGGQFTNISGQARNYIARLDPTTGSADSFDPNVNGEVNSIVTQADGKILVGGGFFTVGGQARYEFARLSNDTAALQNLAVTQTTVTWTRGGSSPQLARTTFEYSTNYTNYTPLGNGMATGSNWTLTGLNLFTGQNIYIRARGFYRSGYLNGSESITESVRNVFLPPPSPLLSIERSGNTNVVLSWATNSTGFTLESKTNLNTNVWSAVSPSPVVSGTNNVVTNTVTGTARFYRLRQ